MNRTLIIIFFLFSLTTYSQKKTSKKTKKETYISAYSLDISYGNLIYQNNYYNQINSLNNFSLELPSKQIGFGFSNGDYTYSPRFSTSNEMSYNYFIPQNISISDTIKGKLKGFSYSLGIGKSLFKKSEYFRLTTYLGFITGRSFLSLENGVSIKNPYFSPKILIQPKLILNKITFSIFASYNYDVSSLNWLSLKDENEYTKIQDFNQTNLRFCFAIGYRLH